MLNEPLNILSKKNDSKTSIDKLKWSPLGKKIGNRKPTTNRQSKQETTNKMANLHPDIIIIALDTNNLNAPSIIWRLEKWIRKH